MHPLPSTPAPPAWPPCSLLRSCLQWPVVTASRWHVQIMMVTVQLGFFLGSAILPIRTPRRPRVSLPVLACLIFIFGPIFAAALMANAPPYAFLVLALCMHTYSGCVRVATPILHRQHGPFVLPACVHQQGSTDANLMDTTRTPCSPSPRFSLSIAAACVRCRAVLCCLRMNPSGCCCPAGT